MTEQSSSPGYTSFKPVLIPSNQSFISQYNQWITGKVTRLYKRNHERVPDTVQSVIVRLLTKDIIGRWFFRHLKDENIDRIQAEHILGGLSLTHCYSLKPFLGDRKDKTSLWRLRDILEYAKFDYERFYFSPQNHTIDSDKVLSLFKKPGAYSFLQSLYRQGRLLPSEFTEHNCSGEKDCLDCKKGRESLLRKRISLIHDWMDNSSLQDVRKLRWNDSQLRPFLRDWKKENRIFNTPKYIMRSDGNGIDAGLLKYAETVINNEVVNEFKRMGRHVDMDLHISSGNEIKCSETSSEDLTYIESSDGDEFEHSIRNFKCMRSQSSFFDSECRHDVLGLIKDAYLTPEEQSVLMRVDFDGDSISEVARSVGQSPQSICKIRSSAISKLRHESEF
jgi:DNA-directed RNA polymerase specialized sigma24 family protein